MQKSNMILAGVIVYLLLLPLIFDKAHSFFYKENAPGLHFNDINQYSRTQSAEMALSTGRFQTDFSLDSLVGNNWNIAYFVGPYNLDRTISSNRLKTDEKTKKRMDLINSKDDRCLILFTQNDSLITYQEIRKAKADLSLLYNTKAGREAKFRIEDGQMIPAE